MPLKPTEIIKQQTGAVTTPARFAVVQNVLPGTLFATNLAGGESVAILFSADGGATFEPMAQDGADLTLTATSNVLFIDAPLLLGVTKTATAGLSGVFIMTNNPGPIRPDVTSSVEAAGYVTPDYVAPDYVE